jgi:lipopolysaccharide biosynthesis glycosyltransferase
VRQKIPVLANRPARHRRAIAFCCDAGYLPFAVAAAEQIHRFAPQRDFDICICDIAPLELPASVEPLDIRSCGIDISGVFDGLRLDKGRTEVVYLRLAIPHAFADDYDTILYMDADIWVQGGDFSALLGLDLGDQVFGAVRDNIQWRTPSRRPEQFKRLGLKTAPYFNAGVLLMNVAAYLERDMLGACLTIGRDHRDQMIRHDQNLLNTVLQGDWAEISPSWNWQYTWASRLFEPMVCPNVVHFIGTRKPWKDDKAQFPPRFAAAFRESFARHDWNWQVPVNPGPMTDRAQMRRMLAKHLFSLGKTSRYLARFPDDLTLVRHRRA